jgi:hypothetical protein
VCFEGRGFARKNCSTMGDQVWEALHLNLDEELGLTNSINRRRTSSAAGLSDTGMSPLRGTRGISGTTDPLLQDMLQAWVNERISPDLLPYNEFLVSQVKQRLADQQEAIEAEAEKIKNGQQVEGRSEGDDVARLVLDLKQLDVDRVQFMLSSYLRCRIFKIEKFAMLIFSDEDYINRVSEEERNFASSYLELIQEHFSTTFLDLIPERFREIDEDTVEAPMSKL